MNKIERLEIKWTTSRGRDTYGYNICTLRCDGGKWSTCGSGYDMLGTVLADYFEEMHQDELRLLAANCANALVDYSGTTRKFQHLYGAFVRENGSVYLDGGCGRSSIEKVIEACGYEIECAVDRKGNVTTFYLQKRV